MAAYHTSRRRQSQRDECVLHAVGSPAEIHGAAVRPTVHIVAIAIATAIVALLPAPVFAQTPAATLTAPAPQSKTPQPKTSQSAPGKPAPSGRKNPCGIYGNGFTNVPGTDTCVKVDGSIQTDVGVNVRR